MIGLSMAGTLAGNRLLDTCISMSALPVRSVQSRKVAYACSHKVVLDWFRAHLPEQNEEKDALIYHSPVPLWQTFNPQRMWTACAVLSLTPTEGVYQWLSNRAEKPKKMVFLHRPWGLDRKRIPHASMVLQSHTRFDELYTTGYNVAFAVQHGVDMTTVKCLQGYKGDPSRRIGLLGKLTTPTRSKQYLESLIADFCGFETQQGIDDDGQEVWAIASLNAFTEEVIQQVLDGLADIPPEKILCITGAAREAGLEATQKRGMQVLCVGHRRCEMWGLRHLAQRLNDELHIQTIIVDEPDLVLERKKDVTNGITSSQSAISPPVI